MNPSTYYKSLLHLFEQNRVPANIAGMKSYMKNRFEFFGIKSPERKVLIKQFITTNGIPKGEELQQTIHLMWADSHREMQYAALTIIEKCVRNMDASFIPFLEKLVIQKSWWDTVDCLAPNCLGKLFIKYPDHLLPYCDRWNCSDNIWLQRSSIIFQLKYREQTDFDLLKKYTLYRSDSEEFFVQKAAGWALRQYGKYNPKDVIDFILENENRLAPLTVREGMKHLQKLI